MADILCSSASASDKAEAGMKQGNVLVDMRADDKKGENRAKMQPE